MKEINKIKKIIQRNKKWFFETISKTEKFFIQTSQNSKREDTIYQYQACKSSLHYRSYKQMNL